ncbi:DgyrCDS1104 [Dimorphilus gyrociliatus]|uniref:Sterol carrier protein 2 n=1 Tax=Dimorphilus gyrociliatus TaxID=2664684 RepID=A0A7I8V8C3_9ANNE|nr:DgyrCDS1104 [Dimorphilus gyrociliatus]
MTERRKVYVIGVGMTKFEKPGRRDNFDYPDMALEAGQKALQDAKIPYDKVQQAVAGYVYGDTTSGQRAVYQLGLTGIPVYNVNNACSTGSTALMMARQFIEGGLNDCVLAIGFEKMQRGPLKIGHTDRVNPMDKHVELMCELEDMTSAPITCQMFGNAGIEHMRKYGTKPIHFSKVAHKNHKHSVNNPYSQFREEYSLQQIVDSQKMHGPLTKLQCCPTSDGSAAAVLASEDFVKAHNLQNQAIEIVAQTMVTDMPSTFKDKSSMKLIGYDLTKKAAEQIYEIAKIQPDDIDVIELHDCFSANELITYEALGLCPEGKAGEFIDKGDNTYGGKFVINPSGGLISKGHPLGATGLAQCAELCWQLRGDAGKRQVKNARLALQHNLGLGGAAVLSLYRHGFPNLSKNQMASGTSSSEPGFDFKSRAIFQRIQEKLNKNGAEYVKKINGIYCFKVKNEQGKEGIWIVDVKNGKGSVNYTNKGAGDITISISDNDLVKLMLGQLNSQQAFFQGKLKIKGNMGLAMKLKEFQSEAQAKL